MLNRKAAAFVASLVSLVVLGGVAWAQVGLKSSMVLQSSTNASGQQLEFPLFRNQFSAVSVEIAPGGQVGRHMHPVPVLVYVIEGEVTIEAEGQPPRTYKAGQAWLEGVNMWHNAFNRGSTPVKFLAVFAGEEGKPLTIRP